MADVDELGITITLKGEAEADRALAGIARSGDAAEKATQGLSRAQQELVARSERAAQAALSVDIQNRKAVDTYLREVAEIRAVAREMGVLAQVEERTSSATRDVGSHLAAVAAQRRALNADLKAGVVAETELAAASGVTRAGLNSMRASVTSLAASVLGAAPGVAQLTSVIGTMAIGSGVMIAVLAGMAALGFAWDKLTENARKAKEENQRALDVLEKLRQKRDQGPAGETGVATAVQTKQLADQIALVRRLETEMEGLRKIGGAGMETSGTSRRLAAARQELINLQDLVSTGNRESARLRQESAAGEQRDEAAALAQRLSFNQKDAAARAQALALLAKDRADYARLLKLPESADNSRAIARVAAEAKQLDEALNPKAKRDPDTRSLATELRARESIAAIEERRVAAAQALAAAAAQGPAFYEAEVRRQALLNEQLETEKRIRESFLDINGKQRAGTEAQMQAEIARARAAIATRQALGDDTRASLDIGKAQQEIEALKAKAESYDHVGAAAKDSAIEVEYNARVTAASAVADEAKRKQLMDLAEEWRRLKRTIAAKDESADATKKAIEDAKRAADEAQRDAERRARQFGRTVSSAVSDALDALGQKGANIFQSWWDAGKRGLNRFIGDAVGQLAAEKFGSVFGVGEGAAATKQSAAGVTMLSAATMQLQAATLMVQAGTWSTAMNGGVADASTVFNPVQGASRLQTAAGYGAIAAGAGMTGYELGSSLASTSHGAFGNYARGGIAGAAAGAGIGATLGTAVFPGIGTAVGAIVGGAAGFVAGLFGAKKGMDDLSAAAINMRKALASTMEGLRAEVSKDALAQSIAQVHAQSAQVRQQIEDAYSGGGANSDTVRERNKLLAEADALERKRIEQLNEEANAIRRYLTEDLRVRELRARGQDKAADDLAFQNQQSREVDEYRRTHDLTKPENRQQLAYLQQVQALEAQKRATEENTDAVNTLTTTMRGQPSGFKTEDLNRYAQQYAQAMPVPGSVPLNPIPLPTGPFTPPTSPLTPSLPSLSRTGTVATSAAQITFAAGSIVVNGANLSVDEIAGKIVPALARKLDDVKQRVWGGSSNSVTRAQALERIPTS